MRHPQLDGDQTMARTGTQSIERTFELLKVIALRGQFGWRLRDIASHCAMSNSTAHRLLGCLVRERMIYLRSRDHHYIPGPMLLELGFALSPAYGKFLSNCEAPLARAALRADAVAYLMLRSGDDCVCARRAGTTRVRGITINVGTRRPLLASLGGIAMLLALKDDERKRVVARNVHALSSYGAQRVTGFQQVLLRSQKAGYAFSFEDMARGLVGVGAAIRDVRGDPLASVTIVGTDQQALREQPKKVLAAMEPELEQIAVEAGRIDLEL